MTITKFNPQKKEVLTIGECLDPAMKIKDKHDVQQYLKDYAAFIQKDIDKDPKIANGKTAIDIAKHNLGYYAGYYDNDVRKKVEELFECSHPVFGTIKENGVPSSEEAFDCGKNGKTLPEMQNTKNVLTEKKRKRDEFN